MNLETLITSQNPQWVSLNYQKPEKEWFHRPHFEKVRDWLEKRPIVALTGLRRTGKSTILKQIQYLLEEKVEPNQIMYFSFEKSQVKFHPDVLRNILDWYVSFIQKKTLATVDVHAYIFLDEIQYIPYWQDVVKTYYDQSVFLKFFLSGSSSLFVRSKSLESLAGRIIEMVVPPLSFTEYCAIQSILQEKSLTRLFSLQPQLVISYFEKYLSFGQFPEPVKDRFTPLQTENYLSSIEEKIIEQDIPKLFRIERIDILRLIFEFVKTHTTGVFEYGNITNDLGTDLKTTRKYFDYLVRSFLVTLCRNRTKKSLKSARTAKKVYLTSANFSHDTSSAARVEDYVFNVLSQRWNTQFFRKGNFEVDFITRTPRSLLPIEVKYQETIGRRDYKNIMKLARALSLSEVLLISKNTLANESVEGVKVHTLPAPLLESYLADINV